MSGQNAKSCILCEPDSELTHELTKQQKLVIEKTCPVRVIISSWSNQ
jgi:hypothetical protein